MKFSEATEKDFWSGTSLAKELIPEGQAWNVFHTQFKQVCDCIK